MNWDDSRLIDQLAYDMILGDYPRGLNRARIASIANGAPPYTDQEVNENGIVVNVNDLSMTRILHDARSQFNNAFLKPGVYFSCKTDYGPRHKRSDYNSILTREIGKAMKRSVSYFESMRSKFGLLTLHGISPACWENTEKWCPKPLGVEDMLVPSNTLLGFDNLPFFALRRSFTGIELQKLTREGFRDPGWNMDMVEASLAWLESQTTQLMGQNWPEVWAPEKVDERIKGDSGFYASDQAPTLDCFDFYAYVSAEDSKDKKEGWVRRIILDAWSTPQAASLGKDGRALYKSSRKKEKVKTKEGKEIDLFAGGKNDFLFSSKGRKVASSWREIVSFQFADLSAVAPFRYHSVRSLGFLLYSVCHLQNRLRGKFNEAVFENLMMLMRVKSMDDVQRALNVMLNNRGFVDDTVSFIPQDERWNPNMQLAELAMNENRQLIQENSSSYTQGTNSRDKQEKTKFQVMAELNASTQLIAAGINQAYEYQKFEDHEVLRRFLQKGSSDPDVQRVQANCLQQGMPERLINYQAWEAEHERVVGGGNKTMELTVMSQLMEWIDRFDPDPQRKIKHDAVLALTDDPARADQLVPEDPVKVTDSVHDAQLATGRLMQGLPMAIKTGLNHVQYCETLMADMAMLLMKAGKQKPTISDIMGLANMGQHVQQHIQIVAQDKEAKAEVKKLEDQLTRIMNQVKNLMKQVQKAAQEQNGQGGGIDPKDMAKIQGMMMAAKVKAQNARESHAQRTTQRQIQFEQEMKQRQVELQAELAKKDLEAAGNIKRNRLKSLEGNGE